MSIFVTDTAKTKAKATLQKRRNLFGLGVTSLIAACSADKAAGTDGTGGGNPVTPAGDIGDRPTAPFFPAKLSATQLAEASIEKLAPVADIGSDHISASTPTGSDDSSTGGSDRSAVNDLKVTIDEASGLVDNNVEITFKNGNHTVDPFVSVHQLKETGKNDLIVTSAGFGYPDGGAIYFFWDIGSRTTTTFDSADDTNFLRILGNPRIPIGNYAPEFLHIGGTNDNEGKLQYDMVFGGDETRDSGKYSNIYIVWDVTQYADTLNQDLAFNVNPLLSANTAIRSHASVDINKYFPEFFNIGGDEYHDMVIRGVGTDGANDNIYIIWDVANPTSSNEQRIDLNNNTSGVKVLNIYSERRNDKIASYAPEFSHIGGDDAQYDMVIRSGVDATAGGIYVLWDVAGSTSISIVLNSSSGNTSGVTHGLLRIFGEATNKTIGAYSPEFLQIGGVGDTANSNAPQQDMIIKSNDGSTIYILWDVAAYYDSTSLATPVTVNLGGGSITNGLLKITGENVGEYSPEFLQIGGTTTQEDMVIRSNTAIYVLWDVAAYYDSGDLTTSVDVNLSSNSAAKGLLKITGTVPGEEIGSSNPDILKINNNGDYDMIIKSNTNMYVLWDFTKDYSTTPTSVSLTDASATTGNGLLTISGAGTANILKDDSTGFADIDGNGINDIVFTYESNTFILFGEKIAYRDANGKAVSHEVDLAAINFVDGVAGFFTADAVTTVAADAIGYRYANDDLDTLADVQGNPPSFSLSDADAVWDIA